MKQILVLALALLPLHNFLLPGHEVTQHDAILVHRYERGCGYSCLQELAADLGGISIKQPTDKVVVRLCSKAPLPIALSTAAAAPEYVASILAESYKYSPERVLLLRSGECAGRNLAVTTTEFWVIPQGAALPPSAESVKYSQVKIELLGEKGEIKSGRSYRATVRKLQEVLRAEPQATGVALGYFYQKPNFRLKRRLNEVSKILKEGGVPSERYFVRLTPWTGEYSTDPPEAEPQYPSFFVVKVAR